MTGLIHILLTAVNAVLPIVLLILLGYLLKRKGFLNSAFAKTGNKLVFNVLLPCMLFINVYDIESFAVIQWDIVLYAVLMVLVIAGMGFVTALAATKKADQRGVLWQCSFRSNFAIIGLSLAGALGGSEAMGMAAIISAFTTPLFNVLAVIALTLFVEKGDSKKLNVKEMLWNMAKNPLILGVAGGLLSLTLRSLQVVLFGDVVFSIRRDIQFVYTAANNLKSIASPLALIVMGAQFEFSAVKGLFRQIAVGTVWRIVLAPLLGVGGAVFLSECIGILSLGVNEYPALIALFGSPVAVSSAVMAAAMKNDEQLATQLVVWTSIFSILTVFLQVCILMGAGLLAV